MEDKPINWIGTSRDDVGSFPEDARRKVGFQLRRVQRGEAPVDFKPISTIGKGVYVLHAFQKKTQKTSKQDINIGQQRYQQMIQDRESQLQEDNYE